MVAQRHLFLGDAAEVGGGRSDRLGEEVPLGLLRDAERAVDSAHEHLTIGAPDDDLVVGEDGRAGTTQRERHRRLAGALVAEEHRRPSAQCHRRAVEAETAQLLQQFLEVHHDVVVDKVIPLIGDVHDEPRHAGAVVRSSVSSLIDVDIRTVPASVSMRRRSPACLGGRDSVPSTATSSTLGGVGSSATGHSRNARGRMSTYRAVTSVEPYVEAAEARPAGLEVAGLRQFGQ